MLGVASASGGGEKGISADRVMWRFELAGSERPGSSPLGLDTTTTHP